MLVVGGFSQMPVLHRVRVGIFAFLLAGAFVSSGNVACAGEGEAGVNSQLEAGGNIKLLNVNTGNTKDLSDALNALNAPRENEKAAGQTPAVPDEAGAASALNAVAPVDKPADPPENQNASGAGSADKANPEAVNPDAVHPSWLIGRWSSDATCKGEGRSPTKGQLLKIEKNTADFGESVHCLINSISGENNNEIIVIYKCSEKKRSSQEVHRFAHINDNEIQLDGYDKWIRCK